MVLYKNRFLKILSMIVWPFILSCYGWLILTKKTFFITLLNFRKASDIKLINVWQHFTSQIYPKFERKIANEQRKFMFIPCRFLSLKTYEFEKSFLWYFETILTEPQSVFQNQNSIKNNGNTR